MKNWGILTATRNRESNLLQALKNWSVYGPQEIVVVDFGSFRAFSDLAGNLMRDFPEIQVHRVADRPRWVLSDAFNLGLARCSSEFVLKLDADHLLEADPRILLENPKNYFFTGNWADSKPGQEFTNGAVLARRDDLLSVGGWDPRIRTYGWDDSDLYERLGLAGLEQKFFPPSFIRHLPHGDSQRVERGPLDETSVLYSTRALINANRAAARLDTFWSGTLEDAIEGRFDTSNSSGLLASSEQRAKAFFSGVFAQSSDPKTPKSSRRLIRNNSVRKLIAKTKRRLRKLIAKTQRRLGLKLLKLGRKYYLFPEKIICQPTHGLGNRLRAISSTYSLAKLFGAEFSIEWATDEHCGADFHDLFDWRGQVRVISVGVEANGRTAGQRTVKIFGPQKLRWKDIIGTRELRLVTANRVRLLPDQDWVEKRFLRALKPSAGVIEKMTGLPTKFQAGFHLRQISGHKWPHLSWEYSKAWSEAEQNAIDTARDAVRIESFVSVARLLEASAVSDHKVFVAADTSESKTLLGKELGERMYSINSPLYRRDKQSVVSAYAEMLMLSKCEILFGSIYSAFSEVAHRMANSDQKMYLAGRDF